MENNINNNNDNNDTQFNPSAGRWKSAIFIILVEMAERFAYYGVAGNLIMYLTNVLHEPVATAAKNVNYWTAVSSLALVIGAFLADSYLGRFKTTLISSSIFLMGLIMLTISTFNDIPPNIKILLFFLGLFETAVGDGGHKPCVQTFAADQFDENTPEEKTVKSSFFNWWYLGIFVGATTAVIVLPYVQDNHSWTIGFGIPTIAVGSALIIFLSGQSIYRKERPVGSPFTSVAQVLVAAFHKRRVSETNNLRGPWRGPVSEMNVNKLGRTKQFKFLDKAMLIDDRDSCMKTRNPWRLCSVNQVEQVKLIIRLIPVWICTFAYAIIVAQVHTFFIKQASTMDRSIGPKFQISAASLQVIPGITILICVPIYDKFIVPTIRNNFTKRPSGISTLQRIGFGLILSIVTIIIAAVVESKRVHVAKGLVDHDSKNATVVPMSVWYLAPQFVTMGLSDMFTYVGMQELFYDQMPEEMRSMGSALTNGAIGVGAIMSSVIIGVVQKVSSKWGSKWLVDDLNHAHLDRFYWLLAGLCVLDLFVFVMVAKWFVWKKTDEGGHQVEIP